MHVVVFGSGSGTNLEALLRHQKQNPSSPFTIKALFTDRQCRFQEIGHREELPVIYHSFARFFKNQGSDNTQNPILRHHYDRETAAMLQACAYQNQFNIDLIVLAGYMRLLTPAILDLFPNKVINVHPGDLDKIDEHGQRPYVGAEAVYTALQRGEPRTRSSVIVVDNKIDAGPLLVLGPWTEYSEGMPVTKEKAQRHQEKQKALSDWPALVAAVKLIAEGQLGITNQGQTVPCVHEM